MYSPTAAQHTTPSGRWNLLIDGVDRTYFRNVPVQLKGIQDNDPFGPANATFEFNQISALEPLGEPDTDTAWLRPDAKVEINFAVDPQLEAGCIAANVSPRYSWKGFIVSFGWQSSEGQSTVEVECIGALHILDNILQKSRKLSQPVAFETAIRIAMNDASANVGLDSRGQPRIYPMGPEFAIFASPGLRDIMPTYNINDVVVYDGGVADDGTGTTGRAPDPRGVEWWRIPQYIRSGQKWSGMLTRDRGNNDKTLSSYVHGLLQMMYTAKGRFSIRLRDNSWQPEFYHLNLFDFHSNAEALNVDIAWPGVGVNLDQDFSQSVSTVYGKVSSSIDGSTYTGAEYNAFGTESRIEPFADKSVVSKNYMKREQFIQFPDGLGVDESLEQAQEHVSRNCEPGYTGQITLNTVDPRVWEFYKEGKYGGRSLVFPKQLIRAGMYIRLKGFQGRSSGLTLYISSVSHDVTNNSSTLTVDSKCRDYLTVDAVRARGRDSMAPVHMLTVGSYSGSTASDRLMPWSPTESGFIPKGSNQMWSDMRRVAALQAKAGGLDEFEMSNFPWYELVKRFPPRDFPDYYCRIPGVDSAKIAARGGRAWGTESRPLTKYEAGEFWYPNVLGTYRDDTWKAFNPSLANKVWKFEKVEKVDEDGNPVLDVNGKPVMTKQVQPFEDTRFWPPVWWQQWMYYIDPDHRPPYVVKDKKIAEWYEAYKGAMALKAQIPDNTVRLASAGKGSALKMMCIDKDGNPLPVSFYIALYSQKNITNDSAGMVPPEGYPFYFEHPSRRGMFPQFQRSSRPRFYEEGSAYPFFPYAGESKLPDGTSGGPEGWEESLRVGGGVNARLLALGSYWERPGYWPWSMQDPEAAANGPTGLLNHEKEFNVSATIDTGTSVPPTPQSIQELSGYGSYTIFCDDLPEVDKFFIGRIYVDARGT